MVPELCGGAPAGAVDRYGLRALVRQAAGRLAAAGVTSPQVDARILAEHLLGRALLLADGADGDFPAAYDALVLRRECREPLQHIIGRMWLRGAELISRPGVFIVRPETEVVAGAAIEAAREVMDGGGGSGPDRGPVHRLGRHCGLRRQGGAGCPGGRCRDQ